jgi:nitroreductase
MKVSQAVLSRKSIRAFSNKSISNELLKELLVNASRSPSGGNLQPWRLCVINNQSMQDFLDFQSSWEGEETPSYDIYPRSLKEPYRTSRYQLGEQMYELLGIARDDKDARINQVLKNFNFFGAPAALFCFIDKEMGPPQWSDLGMFLQTFMLLAQEKGIDTCAQEAWSLKSESVNQFFNIDNSEMLFCGMAIGIRDPDAKVNQLESERRSIDDWAHFF